MDEVIIPKFVVDSRILHQLIDWGLSDEIIRVFTAFQSYQKKNQMVQDFFHQDWVIREPIINQQGLRPPEPFQKQGAHSSQCTR